MGVSLIQLLVIFMKLEMGRDAGLEERLGKGGRSLEETEDLAAERADCEILLTF